MSFNWINAEEYSFNSFLLMDQWMINHISRIKWPEFREYIVNKFKENIKYIIVSNVLSL